MSEDSTPHEGPPAGPDSPPAYTPTQWLADWQAFQAARLDTAEEQRDWILVHCAGEHPATVAQDRAQRMMKALQWLRENQPEVCRLSPWTPGTQMPLLLIRVLYAIFGSGLLDTAPPPTKDDIPAIFVLVRKGAFQ